MNTLWTGRESFKPRPGSRSSVRTHGTFGQKVLRFKTHGALVAALAVDLEKSGIRSAETPQARRG
jgi:hypothetical protein